MKLLNLMYCIFSNQFISKMALDLSFLARQNPLPCPATYIVYFILFCYQIFDPILIHLSMLDWPYIINKKQINLIIQDQQKLLRLYFHDYYNKNKSQWMYCNSTKNLDDKFKFVYFYDKTILEAILKSMFLFTHVDSIIGFVASKIWKIKKNWCCFQFLLTKYCKNTNHFLFVQTM